MFGNPAAERAAIEMTYEDTATISRTEPATGANHITRAVPAVKYFEIICALSYSGSDKSQQTDAQKRFGREDPNSRRLLAFQVVGRPVVYATHQEIKVKDGDLA